MPARNHELHRSLARSHPRESGFSLVELIIAMVILAILTAAVVISFRGAKSSTYAKETKVAGAAYAQAIAQFQADHANKLPVDTDMQGTKGPVNLLGKPYMQSVPDGVANGRTSVDLAAPSCTGPGSGSGTYGSISYCSSSGDISVYTRDSPDAAWPATPSCYLGTTAEAPRC